MPENLMARGSELIGVYLPGLFGSFSVLVLGWLIAVVVSMIVGSIISRTPLNKMLNDLLGQQASLLVPADKKFRYC